MDIDKIEKLGVEDYYLDMIKYINEFVNRNYPLSKEDFRSILSSETKIVEQENELVIEERKPATLSLNVQKREAVFNLMKQELDLILKEKSKEIQQQLESGVHSSKNSVEKYKQEIFNYKERILEKLWDFTSTNELFKKTLNVDEKDNIKECIEEGISAEAVNATLDDMINVSLETGETPKQMKEVVETIAEMKKDTNNIVDESYASSFVKENNQKIKEAINDGISANEIAKTLVEATDKANDKQSRKHLKFVTKFITKLKVKELSLKKEKENSKGMQKVLNK